MELLLLGSTSREYGGEIVTEQVLLLVQSNLLHSLVVVVDCFGYCSRSEDKGSDFANIRSKRKERESRATIIKE